MIKTFLNKYALAFSLLILLGAFLLARLPYFLYSPVPEVATEDTMEYYEVVMQILSGQSKIDFSRISAGYPLFLMFIGFISNTIMAVVIAQNITSFISGAFFIYAIHRCYPNLTIWAAIVFTGYFASENNIHWDSDLYPDSIYASMLLLFCGMLLLAIKKDNNNYYSIASGIAGYLILIRVSSVFIFPLILILIVFIFVNKKTIKTVVALLVPLIIILFSYSAYNSYSIGSFSFIPVKRLSGSTRPVEKRIIASEQDQKFINNVLSFLPPENEYNLIENSWDIDKVNNAYLETRFGNELYLDSSGALILKTIFFKKFNIDTLVANSKLDQYKIYKNEFSQHFGYTKCFIEVSYSNYKYKTINLLAYFSNFTIDYDFYNYRYGWRYFFFYVGRCQTGPFRYYPYNGGKKGIMIDDKLRIFGFKELVNYPAKTSDDFEKEKEKRNASISYKIYGKAKKLFFLVFFKNIIWIILFFAAFIISFYKLIKSKFSDSDSFLVFVFCLINISSALLFALISMALPRYTFTTEFSYYIVISLLPLIINFSLFRTKKFNTNLK